MNIENCILEDNFVKMSVRLVRLVRVLENLVKALTQKPRMYQNEKSIYIFDIEMDSWYDLMAILNFYDAVKLQ